jgi:hypothetical protein
MGKPIPARLEALVWAKSQIGVKEHPPGSNWGPRVRVYLSAAGFKTPAPWCAAFVTWALGKAGYHVTTPGPASVENWEQWAAKHGYLVKRPLRGDIVCYDWNADNWYDHIGFVERVLALRWRRQDVHRPRPQRSKATQPSVTTPTAARSCAAPGGSSPRSSSGCRERPR